MGMWRSAQSDCLVIGVWMVYLGAQGARTTHAKGQGTPPCLFSMTLYAYDELVDQRTSMAACDVSTQGWGHETIQF